MIPIPKSFPADHSILEDSEVDVSCSRAAEQNDVSSIISVFWVTFMYKIELHMIF